MNVEVMFLLTLLCISRIVSQLVEVRVFLR